MSKRYEWEFRYPCGDLVTACRAKLDHHVKRADCWQEELSNAEADLREHGIELREYSATGGNRLQPTFDADRMARVEECRSKLANHNHLADQFSAYLIGFEHSQPSAIIGLHYDDILFFGIAPSVTQGDGEEVPS